MKAKTEIHSLFCKLKKITSICLLFKEREVTGPELRFTRRRRGMKKATTTRKGLGCAAVGMNLRSGRYTLRRL